MEELEDLPILKKTDKGIEAVYEDGNDLPVLKKKDFSESSSPTGGKVGASETPSTGNETAELLGVRPAPKTMQELKQVGVVPKDEKTAQQRVNTFKQQLPQKQATFELEKKKIDDYDTAIEELRKKGDEASLKEADELIGIRNKALATYNKAAAEKQIVENEIGAAESSFREKYGAGNRASYIYNAFLRGIGQMSSGVADAFVNLATQIPGAVSPSMNKEEAVSEIRKEVLPVVREGLKKEVGAEVVPEKEKKYNDEFWTSAIAGLSSSVPAMASPYGAGLYAQAYDSGLESINSIEAGKKLPETTKTIFAASVGAAQGLLEKYGLDKIFGKQSAIAARKLAADAISELLESGAKNITKEAFESAINKSVKGLKDKVVKAGGKIGEGVLVEFGTGSAQEASTIAAEKILNASQPNDIFEPKSWGEEIGRVLYSGAQESVGGGLMAATAAPFSKTRNYIAEKVAEAKTQEDYQALRAEFANNVSPEEAEVANKIIDYYANVNNKIPENTPNRKEVIESIVEREDIKDVIAQKQQELEQVDEAFKPKIEAEIETLNGRIQEINEEIINQPLNTQQAEAAKPMVTEVQFTTKQRERRDQEIEEVQQLRNDLGQDVELINDIPGFVDDVVDRIDLGMMVAPEMLSDAIKELDNQFDKLQAYRNDPARTHTTAQIDAMIDVLGAVKSEIQDYQIKQKENGQKQQTAATKAESTTAPIEGVEAGQEQVAEPLKDVESTAKALEIADKDNWNTISKLSPLKTGAYKERSDLHESISEAYHADKAAGKETELTKAVEQLLTPNINQNEAVNENVREIGNGQKDGQKGDVSQEAKSGVQEEEVTEGGVTAPSLTNAATPQASGVGASLRNVELKMRRPENNEVIFVSVDALLQKHAKDQPSYDIQKEENRIKGRVEKAKEFIKNYIKDQRAINPKTGERMNTKVSFEPSVVDIDANGKISFEDGRHRVLAAKELGITEVPIEVPKERVKAVEQLLSKPNEKTTQKEDGKPLPEGVSGVRTETEERQTSPELRPEEEEVRSIIDNAVANFYAINEATKRSEKREAAKEYRQNLEKMPTVKNIFDNIKSIFAQLEAEGVITKSKDCP